jgi:hypothetical protein
VTAPASARALVLAKRKAAALAMCAAYAECRTAGLRMLSLEHRIGYDACRYCLVSAAKRYPLPQIKRPRVVTDPNIIGEWRCVNGQLESRYRPDEWRKVDYAGVSIDRVKIWADLIARPTELVDDDSAGTSPDGQEVGNA